MKFTPMTDTEIENMHLIPDGIYPYFVSKSADTDDKGQPLLTKGGVYKIQLTLTLDDSSAKGRLLDCVLTSAYPKLLKHFCDTTGLEAQYKTGNIPARDCLNKRGYVVVSSREYFSDKHNKMARFNQVDDFTNEKKVVGQDHGFHNDEIPF